MIPVLVQGAGMPREHELPADLKNLAPRQAIELSDKRWDGDVRELLKAIVDQAAGAPGPNGKKDRRPAPRVSPAIIEYQRRLEAATARLQLIGLGQGVQIELPIQQAYIPLNVVMARDLKNEAQFHFDEKVLRQREHVEEDVQLCDIFKWAARFDSRGVLVLGDPSAGKTTGSRQFCWQVPASRTCRKPSACPPTRCRCCCVCAS